MEKSKTLGSVLDKVIKDIPLQENEAILHHNEGFDLVPSLTEEQEEKTDEQQEYNDFIKACKEMDLYKIVTTAEYGDRLITLSTCDYSIKNGRLVVVAKQMTKGMEE